MPAVSPPTITALPQPPTTADPDNFDVEADAFLPAIVTMASQTNAVAENVYDNALYAEDRATASASSATTAATSAGVAQSAANFKGIWSTLTGALSKPASVYHSGQFWQLLDNLADVTTAEPGVSGSWLSQRSTVATLVTGDWNTQAQIEPITVLVGVDLTNTPQSGRVLVLQAVDSNGFTVQTAYPQGSTFGKVYWRQKVSGTWQAWRQLTQHSEAVIALAGGAIDCQAGRVFSESMAANRTFTITNAPATGIDFSFELEVTMTGGTITWPASVLWPENAPPTLINNRRHLFFFKKSADGTDWLASYLRNYPL